MMQLRMDDALPLRPHGVAAAAAHKPLPAPGWLQQLEAAQTLVPALGHAAAVPGPLRREADTGLEPCGVPQGPAAPLPASVAPPPPSAAPADAAEAPFLFRRDDVAASERSPLRVHVDAHAGAGVSVWLGLDGSAQHGMERAAAAVAGLRQALQGSHQQLVSLVCNGTTLYAASAPLLLRTQKSASISPTTPSKDAP